VNHFHLSVLITSIAGLITALQASESVIDLADSPASDSSRVVVVDKYTQEVVPIRIIEHLDRCKIEAIRKTYEGSLTPKFVGQQRQIAEVDSFAREVAALSPDILVIHYSAFGLGTNFRRERFFQFVRSIEMMRNNKTRYVIYSNSFSDIKKSIAQITSHTGMSMGSKSDRIKLIFVPNGRRFDTIVIGRPIRSEITALYEHINSFIAKRPCNVGSIS